MELIPILSLIILVATVSTFILAVGAYILYKIRERKGRQASTQPASIPAELIAPMPIMEGQATRISGRRTITREGYQEPIYAPTRDSTPQMRPTYVGQGPQTSTVDAARYQRTTGAVQADASKQSAAARFTRYTSENIPEPKKREVKKEEKESLRWR